MNFIATLNLKQQVNLGESSAAAAFKINDP